MPKPLATIVIPVKDQKREWLENAIASAQSQTVPVDVLVVDDGSKEPIWALAPPRVKRHSVNRGIAAALNTGIQTMRTEWFAWLSSDDMVFPQKLEIQLRACQRAGRLASFHPYKVIDGQGRILGTSQPPPRMIHEVVESGVEMPETWEWPDLEAQRKDMSGPGGCLVNGSTSLIHRSVFEDVGLFDESYRYGQDWEMWNRIATKYKWLFVSSVLGIRREAENLTERLSKDRALWDIARAEDRRIMEAYAS